MSYRQPEPSSPLYYAYTYTTTPPRPMQKPEDDTASLNSSRFSTSSQPTRINQLKPKAKINPKPTTAAKNTPSIRPTLVDISTPTRKQQPVLTESIAYSEVKPTFNWSRLGFMCGVSSSRLGDQGCLCGSDCPWRRAWTRNVSGKDGEVFESLLKLPPT